MLQARSQSLHATRLQNESFLRKTATNGQCFGINGPLKQRQKRKWCASSKRDPLELEIWNSWQDTAEDWETEKFTEEELVEILFDVRNTSSNIPYWSTKKTATSTSLSPQEDGSAETAAQNILAIALALLLCLAAGSVFWRLFLVSYALFSAAARYSVVAVLILVLYLIAF